MRKLLLLFSIVYSISAGAQSLVMTKAAFEPVVGDTNKAYVVDTSYYTLGLNVGLTGANTLWTYNNLLASGNIITSAYVDPSAVPASTNYAGCTIVQKSGALNTFYKSVSSPSTQTEFQGINSSSITMNFSNTAVNMRYPFTFGNVITDNFGGAFTFSLSGTASGNATVIADGSGTLVLPNGGVYNNVLRVKSIQNTNFSALIIGGTMKQTTYAWYDASQKFPILSINYQSISISGSGSPTITAQVLGNKNNFVIGINEQQVDPASVLIYPNPTSEEINIHSTSFQVLSIRLINSIGQEVMYVENADRLATSKLAKGVYLAELKTNKGIVRKKLIKE